MVDLGAFIHPALLYRDDGEYLAGAVPFLREGLDAGERVAVAAPASRLQLLSEALGDLAPRVRMIDMTVAGRNPGWIIPGVLRAFADAAPQGRPRIIGEPIWPGRSEVEYPACVLHEALINVAFQGREVSILCPYDATHLPEQVLRDAAVTHPVIIDAHGETASPDFAPDMIISQVNQPLPRPLSADVLAFDAATHGSVRTFAADYARRAGISPGELPELEIAVGELTANSLRHGGGSGTFAIWTSLEHLICEVSDHGKLDDPLAGRRPVPHDRVGGRGLLLVNQVADLVRIYSGPEGTTVRLYFDRRPAAN